MFTTMRRGGPRGQTMGVTRRFLLMAAALGLMVGASGRAEADLALQLSDTADGASITIPDVSGGGSVTFNGRVGEFNINVTTGMSNPLIGDGTLPQMDLSSVDAKDDGSRADTLIVKLTETNWPTTTTSTGLAQDVGGTFAGSITSATFRLFVDPTNTAFGIGSGTISGIALTFNSSPFSGENGLTYVPLAGPYSITQVATITANPGAGNFSFGYALSAVPEPSSLALLVGGLLGLSGAWRRHRRAGARVVA